MKSLSTGKARRKGSLDRRVTVSAASALIFTRDGRYLMQLRDDRDGVAMRGRWGIFGGMVERGEAPRRAIRRELREELGDPPLRRLRWFSEICYDLSYAKPRPALHRKALFELPVSKRELRRLRLLEGERMALFRPRVLLRMENTVPWDVMAVAMHARRAEISRAIRGLPPRRRAR